MLISLLSNINKIFEKLMHSRLIEFLDERQIPYYKQFGFRKDFSTNQKLDHYGIRSVSNDWFRSYLSDRSQLVSINGFISYYKTIKTQCPTRFRSRFLAFLNFHK